MKNNILQFLSLVAAGMIMERKNCFIDGFTLAWYNIDYNQTGEI